MEETRSLKPVRNVNISTYSLSINTCYVCRLSVLQSLSVRPSGLPAFASLLAPFSLFIDFFSPFYPSGFRWKNSTVYRMAYESTGESQQGLVVELPNLNLSGVLNRTENSFSELLCFDCSRTSLPSPSHTSLM